jgi:hypothetical protein
VVQLDFVSSCNQQTSIKEILIFQGNALRVFADIRFHHDDAATFYQLQTQISGASSLANADLQIHQHIYCSHIF